MAETNLVVGRLWDDSETRFWVDPGRAPSLSLKLKASQHVYDIDDTIAGIVWPGVSKEETDPVTLGIRVPCVKA